MKKQQKTNKNKYQAQAPLKGNAGENPTLQRTRLLLQKENEGQKGCELTV